MRLLDRVADLADENWRKMKADADAQDVTVGEVCLPEGTVEVRYEFTVQS